MSVHRARAVKVSLIVLAALLLWLTIVPLTPITQLPREQFPKEWSLDVKGSRRGPSVSSAGGGGNGGRELADDVADEKIRGGGPPNVVHRLSPQKSGHALLGRPSSRVEVLDAVDLTAPKGFLWQPMSVGRLDCSKTHEFCETTVYYCLMKIGEYQENPWKFPMATMLQRHSGCGNPGSGRAYLLSTLRAHVREHPDDFLQPSGFVFHETRTGSTLVANMLAHVPTNLVMSENLVAEIGVRGCPLCSHEDQMELLRILYPLLGNGQAGHTHAFFKFSDATVLERVSQAFPQVPWVYLFRDPVDVMVSNLKGAYGKRNRLYEGFDFDAVNATAYKAPKPKGGGKLFMSPCLHGVPGGNLGAKKAEAKEIMCAKRLRQLCDSAVSALKAEQASNGRIAKGAVVEYTNLPEVVTDFIYPDHFGMGQELLKAHMPYLSTAASMYSKSMANPESKFEIGTDAKYKQLMSEDAYRNAAESTGLMDMYRQLQVLQTWKHTR